MVTWRHSVLVAVGLAWVSAVACDEVGGVGNDCQCTYTDGAGGEVDYQQLLCDDVEAVDAEQIVADECYEISGVPCDCFCDPAAAGAC